MNERRRKLIKLLVGTALTLAVGVALTVLVLNTHGYAQADNQTDRYRILSNAFTIPGVVLMVMAALIFVYNTGLFTGLTYGLRGLKDMFLPFLRQEYVPYREYRKKKMEKKVKGYSFIFFVGLAFFLVSVYFLIRYEGSKAAVESMLMLLETV